MDQPHLSDRDQQIVELKAAGKTQREIGHIVFPNQTQHSADVEVSRKLQKPELQAELQKLYAELNITPRSAIQPVGEALQATKQNQFTGEIDPDHKVRLAASDRARKLLGIDTEQPTGNTTYNFIKIAEKDKVDFGI